MSDTMQAALLNAIAILAAAVISTAALWFKLRSAQIAAELAALEAGKATVAAASHAEQVNQALQNSNAVVAGEARKVKAALAERVVHEEGALEEIRATGEQLIQTTNKIHKLTNSGQGRVLKVAAIALRRVADLTRDRGDVAAALEAERALKDHVSNQELVDQAEMPVQG